MLPSQIPLFPLSNVVLFPGVFQPLHIFEPRYRDMVADALVGDRVIGMVLLREGWESDYEGKPNIYTTGCAGLITHVEQMNDGRYNIVLKGLAKFRILDEGYSRPYRLATVESLIDPLAEEDRPTLRDARHQLELTLAPMLEGTEPHLPANLSDEEVVNALSQYLDLEPIEKQALLECAGPVLRYQLLLELLQIKAMTRNRPGKISAQ